MLRRCYAALGDVSKARYLEKVIELAEKMEAETVSRSMSVSLGISTMSAFLQGVADGTEHYMVQAKLAILSKQFKQAEAILLERVSVAQCLDRLWCVLIEHHALLLCRVKWSRP